MEGAAVGRSVPSGNTFLPLAVNAKSPQGWTRVDITTPSATEGMRSLEVDITPFCCSLIDWSRPIGREWSEGMWCSGLQQTGSLGPRGSRGEREGQLSIPWS